MHTVRTMDVSAFLVSIQMEVDVEMKLSWIS